MSAVNPPLIFYFSGGLANKNPNINVSPPVETIIEFEDKPGNDTKAGEVPKPIGEPVISFNGAPLFKGNTLDDDHYIETILRKVTVHVTFVKIGEINTLKECYEADVLLQISWRALELEAMETEGPVGINPNDYWNPKIYIDNSVGQPKLTSSIQIEKRNLDAEVWFVERKRYQGSFLEPLELLEFPFDVQDLSITIMSELSSNEVELVEDPERIHRIYKQSFIDEQEWLLYKYIESEKKEMSKDRADPTVKRSALLVRCRAARRPAFFISNIFSVTFLLACLSFITFAVDPSLIQNRLQLTFTLVLTTVAFKFVVNQSLPRISYLTYLDRYILATMIVLATISLWHGLHRPFSNMKDKDYIALIVFISLYTLYNLQFILRILLVPYKKRRHMVHLEKQYISAVQEVAEKQASKRRPKLRNVFKSKTP